MTSLSSVRLRVAVFQGPSRAEDVEANLRTLGDVMAEARAMSVDLVLFPELFLCGYDASTIALRRMALDATLYARQPRSAAAAARGTTSPLARASNLARESGVAVAFGYCERVDDGGNGSGSKAVRFYNACALFDATGALVLNYRKTHLWDAGDASATPAHERRIFTEGDALPVADLVIPAARRELSRIPPRFKPKSVLRRNRARTVRVGILICFDGEFPEPARCLAAQGAQIILLPTALGSGPVETLTPNVTVPARAAENHVFILYSNLTGQCHARCGSHMFVGRSAVIGPDGRVVDGARAGSDGGDTGSVMLVADLDGDAYTGAVQRNDYLALRRPQLYARCGLGSGGSATTSSTWASSSLTAQRAVEVASSKSRRGFFSRESGSGRSSRSPSASASAASTSPPLPPGPPPSASPSRRRDDDARPFFTAVAATPDAGAAAAAAAAPLPNDVTNPLHRVGAAFIPVVTIAGASPQSPFPSDPFVSTTVEEIVSRQSPEAHAAIGEVLRSDGAGAMARWQLGQLMEARRSLEGRYAGMEEDRSAQLARKLEESRASAAQLRELIDVKNQALKRSRDDQIVARRALEGDVAAVQTKLSDARAALVKVEVTNDAQLNRLTLQLADIVQTHAESVAAVEERARIATAEAEQRSVAAADAELTALRATCGALERDLAEARDTATEALGREEAARDALVAVCEGDALAEPAKRATYQKRDSVTLAARTPLPSTTTPQPAVERRASWMKSKPKKPKSKSRSKSLQVKSKSKAKAKTEVRAEEEEEEEGEEEEEEVRDSVSPKESMVVEGGKSAVEGEEEEVVAKTKMKKMKGKRKSLGGAKKAKSPSSSGKKKKKKKKVKRKSLGDGKKAKEGGGAEPLSPAEEWRRKKEARDAKDAKKVRKAAKKAEREAEAEE